MASKSVHAGPYIKRLRRQEGLTQAALAARLGISATYLNLLERNQRPLSTRVLMQLVTEFQVDPLALQPDEKIGGNEGIARRLADQRFADLAIARDEIDEFLSATPHIAAAFALLYDNSSPAISVSDDPLVACRHAIDQWRNHFADLDHAAEQLSDELRLSRSDIGAALTEHLRKRHHLSVRILPQEVIPGLRQRLDLHARQVQLSELLAPASRVFQLAKQVAQLEQEDAVEALCNGSGLSPGTAARQLFRRHLMAYFAAALVMPYRRFLRAAVATGYDLPVLQSRFGVSFEQLAHRLTSLQRVGERGLPFFMVRVDAAGQFSKKLLGASNATFLEGEGSCPLWHLHSAFRIPGEWQVQRLSVDSATPGDWVTVAQSHSGSAESQGRYAVALGLEARYAGELTLLRTPSFAAQPITPSGPGCTRCFRPNCIQRAHPPADVPLQQDRLGESTAPYPLKQS